MTHVYNSNSHKPSHIHRITWRSIDLEIEHKPNWMTGIDHIGIISTGRVALPISETGYKSHFLQPEQLEDYEGVVAYVLAWLDHEAKSDAWKNTEAKAAQLSLF